MNVEENEKLTRGGEPMYSLGNEGPIAYCFLVANRGENTDRPLYFTSNDLAHVSATFKRIGAEVVFEHMYKGMELQDVENLLYKLKTTSLKECPCFVFYYSGHGKECGIQLDSNTTFPFLTIIDVINSLKDLEGKPKLFIFDCCLVFDGEQKCRKNCKVESYRDCVIAYACSRGEEAFISSLPGYMGNSSIFTKAFCSMLSENHHQWPLVSILIHASSLTSKTMNGYHHSQTRSMADNMDEPVQSQNPHIVVKLRKQLYLCFDGYVEKTDNSNIYMDFESSVDKNYYRDGVPTKRLQFHSKEDVMNNLGSLGQWLKVFICYAPSVSTNESERKLESRIYTFARHLITYGFDVRVDLFTNFTIGFDWASWTDREISQADWIIFVNSESSYELLCHPSGPKEVEIPAPSVSKANSFDTAVNEATKKIRFSGRALYNRLYRDTTLKIIPVVLLEEDNKPEYILPILRDVNSVLHLYDNVPFDYDKLEGHLERLICRMAGINRMSINATGVQHEYFKLPSKIPQRDREQPQIQPVEQEVTSQAPLNSPYRSTIGSSIPELHSYQTLPQHYYSQENPRSSLNTITQEMYNPPVMSAVHQPQPPFVQAQYPQYSGHSHSNSYYSNPHYSNSNEISQPIVVHNTTSQHLATSTNNSVSSKTTNNDLPGNKIPVDSPILWQLSQEVREWKFLGRFLDLDEDIIEEIDHYTRPNKTRDKSLKVLTEWVNSSSEPTWQALGEALQDAGNTLLYEKLVELIKSHAV